MTAVRLEQITKRFDATVALDDVSLAIEPGELFFLLGPSGCGKSTLLRLIAGLHGPTSGRVLFNGRDVTGLTTERRNAVMVFQSYALWPHMTVAQNVAFGLGVRGVRGGAQAARVREVLSLVRMGEYAGRKPNQLSGGQQQRVALARALAVEPACLLLDEPLSNLDAQLRQEMRGEIRRICKEAGFTAIYVTHDQKEALAVADRIAVMRAGRLAQVGTPAELYLRPTSAFVASFMGQTNLLPGELLGRGAGEMVSLRPEQIRIGDGVGGGGTQLAGRLVSTTFLGDVAEHTVEVAGHRVKVLSSPPRLVAPGPVTLEFSPESAVSVGE
jgi:iron(III) transport system ATP-binding protein